MAAPTSSATSTISVMSVNRRIGEASAFLSGRQRESGLADLVAPGQDPAQGVVVLDLVAQVDLEGDGPAVAPCRQGLEHAAEIENALIQRRVRIPTPAGVVRQ